MPASVTGPLWAFGWGLAAASGVLAGAILGWASQPSSSSVRSPAEAGRSLTPGPAAVPRWMSRARLRVSRSKPTFAPRRSIAKALPQLHPIVSITRPSYRNARRWRALDESQQVGVDPILERCREAVRGARIVD